MMFEKNDLSDPTDYNTLSDNYNEMWEQYQTLYRFVKFVARDYVELSHDKVRIQRDDYILRARKIINDLG